MMSTWCCIRLIVAARAPRDDITMNDRTASGFERSACWICNWDCLRRVVKMYAANIVIACDGARLFGGDDVFAIEASAKLDIIR